MPSTDSERKHPSEYPEPQDRPVSGDPGCPFRIFCLITIALAVVRLLTA